MTEKRPKDPMEEVTFIERLCSEGLAACDEMMSCGVDPCNEGPDLGRDGADAGEMFDVSTDIEKELYE